MKISWRILCACACLVIGISVVLPYFSVSGLGVTVSKSMMDSNEGVYVLIIAAVALVFSLIGKFIPVIFLGMASFGMVFIENNSIRTNLGKEVDALARAILNRGIGYYCLLIGSIALILFSLIGLIRRKK